MIRRVSDWQRSKHADEFVEVGQLRLVPVIVGCPIVERLALQFSKFHGWLLANWHIFLKKWKDRRGYFIVG